MLRLRILFAAVLALATIAVVAIPAGAAGAPSPKFCSAYAKISGGSDQPTPKQAKALAAKFKAAGKQAPAKVKSAANTIVSVLSKLGNITAGNAADLGKFYTSADFRKYGKAIGTFFKYTSACRRGQLTSPKGPDLMRLRILLVAVLALASFGVLASPAVASVSTSSSSSFCKPIKGISSKLQSAGTNTSKFRASTFKKFADALRSSGKHAPAKVKKAANTLASFYSALGGGDVSGLAEHGQRVRCDRHVLRVRRHALLVTAPRG